MKKLLLWPLIGLLLLAASCEDREDDSAGQDTATVNLQFNSFYGADRLRMFEEVYSYEEGMNLQLQIFQFYASDIRLLKADGGEVVLQDVALLRFNDDYSEAEAEAGVLLTDIEVPEGEYTGVAMGFGVSSELNATQPSDYEIGHPLSDNYWSASKSYIGYKIEANGDFDGDGEATERLTYHIGGSNNYRELTFDKAMILRPDSEETLSFEVDLREMLVADDGTFLDIRDVPVNHAEDSPTAAFLSNNIPGAVRLK